MSKAPLAAAILAALVAGFSYPAHAATGPQDSQETDTQTTQDSTKDNTEKADEKKATNVKAVSVTGSLLRHPEYQTTAPIQTIDIEADMAAGQFDTADMLQSTAVAAGATQINNQFSGYNVSGGTGIQTIDLRGLGSQRTLVLLDGQRPGPAGTRGQTGSGFDLNVIPQVILGRIEIVKDGSSSIYGSDAVAGVVNLITKKKMDKLEFSSSVTMPQHGGGKQVTASLGGGWNFDNGNVMVAAQFQEQFPLAQRQRDEFNCPKDIVWGTDGQRIDRKGHVGSARYLAGRLQQPVRQFDQLLPRPPFQNPLRALQGRQHGRPFPGLPSAPVPRADLR